MTDDELEKVRNFGALGYTDIDAMSAVLSWTPQEVRAARKKKTSVFNKAYKEGEHKAEYLVDMKLFEMASSGDIKALEKLEERKEERLFD